jgi:hypothetical protein
MMLKRKEKVPGFSLFTTSGGFIPLRSNSSAASFVPRSIRSFLMTSNNAPKRAPTMADTTDTSTILGGDGSMKESDFLTCLSMPIALVILRFHDVHDLVVVYQLAETFEVTIEVLVPLRIVWSVDIADQDQSAGVEIVGPLSR